MNILFIDNFDSFSHTLVDEFARRKCHVEVWRNDVAARQLADIALALPIPRLMVISPGPGRPCDAGSCMELVQKLAGQIPIFGVCLGHQILVEAFGGKVGRAGEVVHGKTSRVTHDGKTFLVGLPEPLTVGRYHSLAALELPQGFTLRASFNNTPMAVEHEQLGLAGVQFHPESILTPQGGQLIEGIMHWAEALNARHEVGNTCAR